MRHGGPPLVPHGSTARCRRTLLPRLLLVGLDIACDVLSHEDSAAARLGGNRGLGGIRGIGGETGQVVEDPRAAAVLPRRLLPRGIPGLEGGGEGAAVACWRCHAGVCSSVYLRK